MINIMIVTILWYIENISNENKILNEGLLELFSKAFLRVACLESMDLVMYVGLYYV